MHSLENCNLCIFCLLIIDFLTIGLYLRKCSTVSNDKKICDISGGNGLPSGSALDVDAIGNMAILLAK